MTGTHYAMLAYAVGFGLLWGYAAMLCLRLRRIKRRASATIIEDRGSGI